MHGLQTMMLSSGDFRTSFGKGEHFHTDPLQLPRPLIL
jgi:hypothetical protein